MGSFIHNIAIIGAGQIGSRHLQALALSEIPIYIQVIDGNSEALSTAKTKFLHVKSKGNVKGIEFSNSINVLKKELDLVIIATGANVRRKIIEELLQKKKLKFLILEKVLFQKEEDYHVVENLLNKLKVKTWVNCPRRMWPIYKDLKKHLLNSKRIQLNVFGTDIGLGCNGIHFIDLWSYLGDNCNFILNGNLLDNIIIPSKREGYKEFTGTLQGFSSTGSLFSITSLNKKSIPLLLQINSENIQCQIREQEGKVFISSSTNNWEYKEISFAPPFQSQLTHIVLQQLVKYGNCELTSFTESCKLHIPFINTLLKHYNKHLNKEDIICPIT